MRSPCVSHPITEPQIDDNYEFLCRLWSPVVGAAEGGAVARGFQRVNNRHDISPVFTGIPVFLSCRRSFLWKSQNRFKNLGDFYGGGGVYLLGDLIDLLLSRLNTLLQCFINPSHRYSQSTHCL